MEYKHLGPKLGSAYRQWAVTGRGVWAETLWQATTGDEPLTPEAVADRWNVPVEAVREAIHYCEHNQELLQQERDEDYADYMARRAKGEFLTPNGKPAI